MALTLTASNSQYFARTIGLNRNAFAGQSGNAPGVTMFAWVRLNAAVTDICQIFGLGSSSASGSSSVGWGSGGGTVFLLEEWPDSGSGGTTCIATNGVGTPSGWMCVACSLLSDGNSLIYVSNQDGSVASGGAQTATETFDSVMIGFQNTHNFGGATAHTSENVVDVAEFAIWRGILGQSEISLLFEGLNPSKVRPEILFAYYPLRDSLKDLGSQQLHLLPIGGAAIKFTDHPPVDKIITRRLVTAATVVIHSGDVYSLHPW